MPSLQIRNLRDDLYQALAFRAERAQRSLAQQALVELRSEAAEQPLARRRRILEAIKRGLPRHPASLTPSLEALIRDDRER